MNMQMDASYVGAVVISGLVIVFTALLLLIFAVSILGKIFTSVKISDKSSEKVLSKPAETPVVRSMPSAAADLQDDQEIIAVIAAAVAAMSQECGKPLKIKSISRAGVPIKSNAWARAAQSENTRVF